ncbi:unnamed protein product [Lactuca virosa]|uniref:RNA polymerase II associated factor Paf1 n=1 Tax=Lactuca virosa TaxID=75947 RepID=A0AAU9ML96_9ASTR|nr:unnamed protein product [Lactuca virosa]
MASYRPFPPPPPQSNFGPPIPPPPNQTSLPPPQLAPVPQPRGNMFSQNWSYPASSFQPGVYAALPRPPVPNQQQHYSSYPPPPPPPLESAYPPPLPPPSQPPRPGQMYFPSSQNPLLNNQPPPPPPSSPPTSSIPPPPPPPQSQPPSPPPPPSSVPSTNQTKEHRQSDHKVSSKRESHHKVPSREHAKPSALPPMPARTSKAETEEERRIRKKREMEKQRQEEKHKQQLKESQDKILQKTRILSSSSIKPHGSITGSHIGERKATPFLSGERAENRLKKPTTFLCKLKFRDELPDSTAQPKLLSLRRDKDRAAKYGITSLENAHKPQLYVEPDLGIPLDLLDLSVYNAPKNEILHVAPEDEKLLQEDVSVTPIKKDGLKRKDRPTDKGMSWLVKTQYISPLTTDATRQSLTEKQAKERETRGRNMLDSMNSRERKIQDILSSFEACKSHPVHATNKKLQPVEILPLFPDFERWDDKLVVATFDGAPTADSESYNKMDKSVRDAYESQAVMKSFVANTSGSAKPDKFLAYMVPSVGELSKDIYDENEDISYTWVREYHWDVRGEDADDPTNYLVAFDESEARYMPLPTKLMLRKKRAKEGKTSDEVEHFPVPSTVTIRQRSTVSIDMKESESYVGSKGRSLSSSRHERRIEMEDDDDNGDMDQSSGAEYDNMSD